ncbi:hypothetical protein EGR_03385 [Echinococcus granulosus]|uniref:Uncharacterized protein n=1 Tax=Echinococcus granulosus TaxID=6210 RepID=W6V627_ECHGR|nr:hypothetical protein EGR_03385 [Echinococcus granulosus]EUB61839.1 hypothetical protein EGR_03385 [Echinococcus granulosus]
MDKASSESSSNHWQVCVPVSVKDGVCPMRPINGGPGGQLEYSPNPSLALSTSSFKLRAKDQEREAAGAEAVERENFPSASSSISSLVCADRGRRHAPSTAVARIPHARPRASVRAIDFSLDHAPIPHHQ